MSSSIEPIRVSRTESFPADVSMAEKLAVRPSRPHWPWCRPLCGDMTRARGEGSSHRARARWPCCALSIRFAGGEHLGAAPDAQPQVRYADHGHDDHVEQDRRHDELLAAEVRIGECDRHSRMPHRGREREYGAILAVRASELMAGPQRAQCEHG